MNREEYEQKIQNLLYPVTYTKLKKDPTGAKLRNINRLIKISSIDENTMKRIIRPSVSVPGSPTYDIAKYLSSLLQPHLGSTGTYIKDSEDFIKTIQDLILDPTDMLVSFDVESLFTKVPVDESIELVAELFEESTTNLFKACLKGSYFLWNGYYYEQKEGVAIGSLLSPVVANLFMEKFEETALITAPLKPTIWYRYVDDTFVIWRHGRKNLDIFLDHLHKQHPDIQFTVEVEQNYQLAFLDVLVPRQGNRLDHKVYRKATPTNRYLHKLSNHHPSQKQGIIKTLTDRARKICGPQDLTRELQHLEKAFLQNGYSQLDIKRPVGVGRAEKSESTMKAFLPFVPKVTDRIGRFLRKHNIRTTSPQQRSENV
uniref:Reverse transcriptase domain-containing protein n=2 Tax=Dendroctonus ponderosae TaxID=77166 RepID=A0AAR5QIB8_DENPD